jgi:DNA-binding HxlR family transcriptional regulator
MKPRASQGNSVCVQRSACPIANALDLLGDKWTLLVVRDLMFRDRRLYSELAQCEEGIPTNILADRLKRLEGAGLIRKSPYQDHPVRYEYALTQSGAELLPVIAELVRWASKHIAGAKPPPKAFFRGKPSPRPPRRTGKPRNPLR